MTDLLPRSEAALAQMLLDLQRLIRCETPSDDLPAVAAGAALVDEIGTGYLGAAAERLVVDGRTHLRWRLGPDTGPRVLIVCHQDTVWPIGSLERLPFSVVDGVVRGPGCFDMKTGVVMTLHALRLLEAAAGRLPVTVLVTGDEELGSPSSRELIESEARTATAALVLEASADGGAIKTGRKGASMWRVEVTGRAAHAGLEPDKGVSAGLELARLALQIADFGDAAAGTSVVPTAFAAGTTTNTVPGFGTLAVDSRAWTVAEQERVDTAMRALTTQHPDAVINLVGGINRPPLEQSSSQALFDLAQKLSEQLGTGVLQQASVGGASDGNFTAGVGCPTLDGLGAVGGGAHADSEHTLVAEIPRRTALLAALIRAVLDGAPTS